jgi:DNA invertase Pin-like site-specific DNA recombinase
MSKLNLYIEGVKIAEIENKLSELNKYVVVVETKYLDKLKEANIPIKVFPSDYFIVKQGRKNKKFNEEQQAKIREDLTQGLSIRECSTKYKCSTRTIQNIKQNKY